MSKENKKRRQRKIMGKRILISTLCIFMIAVMFLPYIVSALGV